ncbi:MAG: DUF2092 domain-containing protein [marine benthic group bacterium]|nr:DUF2092 domain-containing protein [Gemmatimonadota bacterium]
MSRNLIAAACALGVLALTAVAVPQLGAQDSEVDPAAVELLQTTMDYLGGLESFSAFVFNLREDLLDSGQRIDLEASGGVTVVRPNKLRGVRHAGAVDEVLVYDGERVTVYNDVKQAYMTMEAPPTIEEMFLALYAFVEIYPVSDLIWQDAFPYLMQGVDFAKVVGTEVIGGVACTHLVFGRPDLGFQIWIPTDGPPLPAKYVVTDHGTPEMLSIVTYITDWNLEPSVSDDTFTFVPPEGAKKVPFPKPDSSH